MGVDQLKKRANASMKDHFLDNWANLKSATKIAELFDNSEDIRKGSVNCHEIDILRDTGATIDLVCAKYINPSFSAKAAKEEKGVDSGDAKKGEDEPIIVSSDAEDEILIPALQEYNQALRTVSHESTGYTPSELVYGKNLRTSDTLVMEHWMEPKEESDLVTEYMFKLINRLKRCQEVAINKMEEMQVKRKTWYDKNAVKCEFKDGDLVLVLATSRVNKLAV
ncbi:CCHC-type domain-containing protein [Trichonephila clavipes]|nr:CCHC-type domain-containing protein [Trichonephila clavipes]